MDGVRLDIEDPSDHTTGHPAGVELVEEHRVLVVTVQHVDGDQGQAGPPLTLHLGLVCGLDVDIVSLGGLEVEWSGDCDEALKYCKDIEPVARCDVVTDSWETSIK